MRIRDRDRQVLLIQMARTGTAETGESKTVHGRTEEAEPAEGGEEAAPAHECKFLGRRLPDPVRLCEPPGRIGRNAAVYPESHPDTPREIPEGREGTEVYLREGSGTEGRQAHPHGHEPMQSGDHPQSMAVRRNSYRSALLGRPVPEDSRVFCKVRRENGENRGTADREKVVRIQKPRAAEGHQESNRGAALPEKYKTDCRLCPGQGHRGVRDQ